MPRSSTPSGSNRLLNVTVLVVDDDVGFLESTRKTLVNSGFKNVLTAVDIPTATKLIEAYQPSVALVDLDLGTRSQSGMDLVRQLGRHIDGPIPVVLSGDRSLEQFFRAARAGAIDFLVKGPHVDVPREVGRLINGKRGAAKGRSLHEIVSDLGYLRSFGLTRGEIAVLVDFAKGFPKLSDLAERRAQAPVQTRKTFSRIYEKLGIPDLHQLIRTLTVCELFNREN
jgi:DNA-binding NarL/FixJ family response regulator